MTVLSLSKILAAINLDDPLVTYHDDKGKNFLDDPLVLSVSLYELMKLNPGSYYSLDDIRVVENVTNDIKNTAEQIRKYYSKKWFWSNLGGVRLSDFRARVCYLLETQSRKCVDRDQGIYYKLPYFYYEDMIYNKFKEKYVTDELPRIVFGDAEPVKAMMSAILELTYVDSTISRQQKRKIERFWFSDGTYLYSIQIDQHNPLIEMFRSLITKGEPIKLNTYYSIDRIDQMYFYKLFNFNFIKESNA